MRITRAFVSSEREREYLDDIDTLGGDPNALELARCLQRAAFYGNPQYQNDDFVPAPVYASQAVALIKDRMFREQVKLLLDHF